MLESHFVGYILIYAIHAFVDNESPVCRIAMQEKYWAVPLRGFRLGRNSTEDLLHLLLPFERHPED
jgi:hypothetical protein